MVRARVRVRVRVRVQHLPKRQHKKYSYNLFDK